MSWARNTAASRVALERGQYARGRAVYVVACDECGTTFEGTRLDRARAGWMKRWRTLQTTPKFRVDLPQTRIRVQLDVCASCKGTMQHHAAAKDQP